jgi:cobalamin biosynthesis protein CobD/CbiB
MSDKEPLEIIRETVAELKQLRKRLYLGVLCGLLLSALSAMNFVILPTLKAMNGALALIASALVVRHLQLIRQNLEACRKGQKVLDEHESITTGRQNN